MDVESENCRKKKSMRRPPTRYYSSVGGEGILRAADKGGASKIPHQGIAGRNIVDFFH